MHTPDRDATIVSMIETARRMVQEVEAHPDLLVTDFGVHLASVLAMLKDLAGPSVVLDGLLSRVYAAFQKLSFSQRLEVQRSVGGRLKGLKMQPADKAAHHLGESLRRGNSTP